MQDKAAIDTFLDEFSKFETMSIGMALRALSKDSLSVEDAEKLLDFEARLKLVERMALARHVPASLMLELEAVLLRARKLHELREEVTRNVAAESAETPQQATIPPAGRKPGKARKANFARLAQLANAVPAVAQVEDYARAAIELQTALRTISESLGQYLTVSDTELG